MANNMSLFFLASTLHQPDTQRNTSAGMARGELDLPFAAEMFWLPLGTTF